MKSCGCERTGPCIGKASAIYRIEKPRNPESRRKKGKNIGKILVCLPILGLFVLFFCLFWVNFSYFFAYSGCIFPIFCLFFSYFLHFGDFLFCRWPRLSQAMPMNRRSCSFWDPHPKHLWRGCFSNNLARQERKDSRNYFHVTLGGFKKALLDERQITHLICARLRYDLYDFFRGCLGPASLLFLV